MTPLKLSSIDQEHLQELYDASGVARDELPYTEAFETLWQGFQDRTFKNATRDQLYAALLKYTRSSSNAAKPSEGAMLNDEQKKMLKMLVSKHGIAGKLLPYTPGFDNALKEFNQNSGATVTEQEFWHAAAGGNKRRPPRRVAKVAKEAEVEDDGE